MKTRRKKLRNMIRKPRNKKTRKYPPTEINADNLAILAQTAASINDDSRNKLFLDALGIKPLTKKENELILFQNLMMGVTA